MKHTTCSTLYTLTALAVLLLSSGARSEESAAKPQAPSFSVRDINNRLVSTDSLLKKGPVIVDFWATWCIHCMSEMKMLTRLVEKYGADRFTVLAISQDAPAERSKVRQVAKSKKWPFTIAIDNGKSIAQSYQVNALPALFLVGKDGTIAAVARGFTAGDEATLEETLGRLLDAK